MLKKKLIDMPCKKAHTLPSRTCRPTNQNLAKSVLYTTQKEIQFLFSLPSETIKTPDTQTNPTKTVKLNNDNCLQTRSTRTPAHNRHLAQWWGKFLIESFLLRNPKLRQGKTLVFSLKNEI